VIYLQRSSSGGRRTFTGRRACATTAALALCALPAAAQAHEPAAAGPGGQAFNPFGQARDLAPHDGRDPSFEVYKPPYLFRGPQPKIRKVRSKVGYGRTFGVSTDLRSAEVDGVVLIRFATVTHLIDGGQRRIELPVQARRGPEHLLVKAPPHGAVAPPGPYMLFVLRRTAQGPVPSVARTVMMG
jgi:hypothetical protein